LMHPERLKQMASTARRLAKPDATRTVVDVCLEVARG
jgi:UDP-N-acetylglucosamine--N-acetylmuramyl-(pentapeptide) pyrophosphoryl-undecaprenol N-acetylglucosamine transferase